MAGREVREYTNLSDPKDKKWGKGKDKIDDEDITFQRMVAKQMQEVAGERGGYLHGRGALDSDDLLYLKEQMEAEEDAERLLRRTEKRAFAAFKISFHVPVWTKIFNLPLNLQHDLLKKVVEVKPKRPRVSSPSVGNQSSLVSSNSASKNLKSEVDQKHGGERTSPMSNKPETQTEVENPVKSLLGLAYASSDDED
ncbi:hypothetical protein Pint_16600 [Pistacia integerrima]|uniref:Uncharacterized protein n=1 Tax=Pistacia integerrima TaxID=434235 RepID=A0ACC0ZBL7_9ROSI|nr:hypothetical protein Pint_16600 [Pistacia integerrima]